MVEPPGIPGNSHRFKIISWWTIGFKTLLKVLINIGFDLFKSCLVNHESAEKTWNFIQKWCKSQSAYSLHSSTPLQQMFVWEKKLKDARLLMHAEACYKSTMQRVRAFSYGYNLPLPLSGNMLQGSGPCHGLQCDTNRYPARVVVTPLTLLLLPCSSRSSRMRYALRGHDPHTQWDGPRAGHLNYFKTATVDRLETRLKVSWRIRIWTFTHFCLTRPILSSSHPLPRIPIFVNCPLKRPLNLPPMVLPSSSSWLPRDFPGRSILHSSRISPSPARCCWWCPNIHIHATHIHPSSQKQLIPHLKSHCLHTPTQCTKWMYHLMKGFSLRGSMELKSFLIDSVEQANTS